MSSDLTRKMHERQSKRKKNLYKPAPDPCSMQNETTVKGKSETVQLKVSFDWMILEFFGKAGK